MECILTLDDRAALARAELEDSFQRSRDRRERCRELLRDRRVRIAIGIGVALIVVVLALFSPRPAYASLFSSVEDLFSNFGSWIGNSLFGGASSSLLNGIYENLNGIDADVLMASWNDLLNLGNVSIYSVISTINSQIVQPVAISILGLVMLTELISIAQKFQSNDIMPGFKEIFFFAVYLFLFETLIRNSLGIVEGVYDITLDMTENVSDKLSSTWPTGGIELTGYDGAGIGDWFLVLILSFFLWCGSMILSVVVYVMFYARSLQLYILGAFSSLGFAMLASEHTRQMGIGYIRNMVAVALSGVIMILLLRLAPTLISAFAIGSQIDVGELSSKMIPLFAIMMCETYAFFNAGSWARNILGA